jgi:hypothetical protein
MEGSRPGKSRMGLSRKGKEQEQSPSRGRAVLNEGNTDKKAESSVR